MIEVFFGNDTGTIKKIKIKSAWKGGGGGIKKNCVVIKKCLASLL